MLLQGFLYVRTCKSDNEYAHPLDMCPLVDLNLGKVIHVDMYDEPARMPPMMVNYHRDLAKATTGDTAISHADMCWWQKKWSGMGLPYAACEQLPAMITISFISMNTYWICEVVYAGSSKYSPIKMAYRVIGG
eukprot:GHUV01052842.1.p2 GENE.GHUV01052842.1~~GHUV01052842.1.p2  ORF type:complete len:133 (-),score=18.63 GHUV01052842.1:214-612(-)